MAQDVGAQSARKIGAERSIRVRQPSTSEDVRVKVISRLAKETLELWLDVLRPLPALVGVTLDTTLALVIALSITCLWAIVAFVPVIAVASVLRVWWP